MNGIKISSFFLSGAPTDKEKKQSRVFSLYGFFRVGIIGFLMMMSSSVFADVSGTFTIQGDYILLHGLQNLDQNAGTGYMLAIYGAYNDATTTPALGVANWSNVNGNSYFNNPANDCEILDFNTTLKCNFKEGLWNATGNDFAYSNNLSAPFYIIFKDAVFTDNEYIYYSPMQWVSEELVSFDTATSTSVTRLDYPPNNFTSSSTTQYFQATIFTNNVQAPHADTVCLYLFESGIQQSPLPYCKPITASAFSSYIWNITTRADSQYVWYVTIQGSGQYSADRYARSLTRVFCVYSCSADVNQTPLPGLEDDIATSTVLSTLQAQFLTLRGGFFDKFPFNWLVDSATILLALTDMTATSSPIATTTIDFRDTVTSLSTIPTSTPGVTASSTTLQLFSMATFLTAGDIPSVQFLRTVASWILIIGTVFYICRGAIALVSTGNTTGT